MQRQVCAEVERQLSDGMVDWSRFDVSYCNTAEPDYWVSRGLESLRASFRSPRVSLSLNSTQSGSSRGTLGYQSSIKILKGHTAEVLLITASFRAPYSTEAEVSQGFRVWG